MKDMLSAQETFIKEFREEMKMHQEMEVAQAINPYFHILRGSSMTVL
jgi:hypothetical protein